MKKTLLLLSFSLAIVGTAFAQNVGINATGALPHPSAMLDVSSSDKGMLMPRTSTASRLAIVNPAKGLMVYDTTTSSCWFHDGSTWNEIPKGSTGGANFWSLKDTNIYNNNHGHVGIGTDTAQEPLTIQTAELSRGFSHRGPNGKILSSFMGDSFVELATLDNSDLYLGAGGIPHVILNGTSGNVGINTTRPFNTLQVGDPVPAISNFQFAIGNGTNGSGFIQNSLATWVSTTNISIIPGFGSSGIPSVGIGTSEAGKNKFQIGNSGGFIGNDIAFGNGTQVTGIAQTPTLSEYGSNTDISFLPGYTAPKGHLGISVTSGALANRLQIGNVTGFVETDIAFGNGTQASGITQTAGMAEYISSTDMGLFPKHGSGSGRVGINTTAPRAILDVEGSVPLDYNGGDGYAFYTIAFNFQGGFPTAYTGGVNSTAPTSIYASDRILCVEFDAFSDARIKNIKGTSNSQKDLETLKKIEVTDYTMKDKLKYGDRSTKKVIAQQVETVYPQVVSKHVDFIPNVYQFTDSVTKTEGGYRLHFRHEHHLGDTAKKIEAMLTERGNLEFFDIVSIPSTTDVVINAKEIKTNHIFVYGEQIPDFHTVDYDGLTTLNISATQELNRIVEVQQRQIDLLEKRISQLETHPRRNKKSKLSTDGSLSVAIAK